MKSSFAVFLGAASVALTHSAAAQTAAASGTGELAEIVVSASRISRDGFTAPTPTTLVGQELIQERAVANLGDALNKVPAFRAAVTPNAGGLGNTGAFLADLRGLGPTRTLVMLDRGRMPQTIVPGAGGAGTTDLNTIPTVLVRNAEIVTGGASAAYGSDAVAGVINFTLDEHFTGIRGSVQAGETRYHDARDVFATLAGGTSFAGERGHAVLGLEYNNDKGTAYYNTERAWGRQAWNIATFAVRPAGTPFNVLGPNGNYFGSATSGGLIQTAGALQGLAFVPNGSGGVTTATFNRGLGNLRTSLDFFTDAALAGNSAAGIMNLNTQQLRPAQERYNALAKVTFDISDHLSAYVEPLYSNVTTEGIILVRRDGAGAGPGLTFAQDNYYLQQALTAAQRSLVPAAGLTIGYTGNAFGPNVRRIEKELVRVQTGLHGDFGSSWKWDVGYLYATNKSDVAVSNNFNNTNFRNAIDVVLLSGQPACRSATARAAGCVPVNILGGQTVLSPEAASYILGVATGVGKTTLSDVSANIQGEPFSSWAGPVSVGIGAEYREESVRIDTDALSRSSTWLTGTGAALPKVQNDVKEGYVETVVPLAKDLPFARTLDFNGAARVTDYSTSGNVTTWKLGMTWSPAAGVLVRATRSRDIRAPNLVELFTPQTQSLPLPADPRPSVARPTNSAGFVVGGNPNLKPEKSITQTFGISYQPEQVQNLKLSVDYYSIEINDAIASTGTQGVVNNCFIGGVYTGNAWCSLITFANNDPVAGQMTAVQGVTANVANFSTRGFDIQANYRRQLSDFSARLRGALGLNLLVTTVTSFKSSTDVSTLFPKGIDRSGQTGAAFGGPAGLPSWLLNLGVNYEVDKWTVNANGRFVSRSHQNNGTFGPDQAGYDPTLTTSINNNNVPSMTYFDLGLKYRLGGRIGSELFFNVDNVFDKDPPLPANGSAYYDLMGRAFKVGVRFNL